MGPIERATRKEKKEHPDRFCKTKGCLWRNGEYGPCIRHEGGIEPTPEEWKQRAEKANKERGEFFHRIPRIRLQSILLIFDKNNFFYFEKLNHSSKY